MPAWMRNSGMTDQHFEGERKTSMLIQDDGMLCMYLDCITILTAQKPV